MTEGDVTINMDPQTSGLQKRKRDDDEGPSSVKDPDEKNMRMVGSPKKQCTESNDKLKIRVLKGIMKSFLALHSSLKLSSSDLFNVDISTQMSDILVTVYGILRLEASGIQHAKLDEAEGSGFAVDAPGNKTHRVSLEECLANMKTAFGQVGLEFRECGPKKKDWYGIAKFFLNSFCGYGLRLKELRLGHAQMVAEENGESVSFMTDDYGIRGGQHALLEGCTYPPEKRLCLVRFLGPLTVLLCYIRSTGEHTAKWRTAAVRAFKCIPDIYDILDEVIGKDPSQISNLITTLGDIYMIAHSRHATKAFLPLNLITYLAAPQEDLTKLAGVERPESIDIGGKVIKLGVPLLKALNFFGRGAFLFWKVAGCMAEWTMNGEWSQTEAAQVMYHSVFGTFKEYTETLSKTTDHSRWYKWEELEAKFKKHNSEGTYVKFPLVKQRYWSKQKGPSSLDRDSFQSSSISCFGGPRRIVFSQDFLDSLKRAEERRLREKTIAQFTATLSDLFSSLLADYERDGRIWNGQTTYWYDVDELSTRETDGNSIDEFCVPRKGTRFFDK